MASLLGTYLNDTLALPIYKLRCVSVAVAIWRRTLSLPQRLHSKVCFSWNTQRLPTNMLDNGIGPEPGILPMGAAAAATNVAGGTATGLQACLGGSSLRATVPATVVMLSTWKTFKGQWLTRSYINANGLETCLKFWQGVRLLAHQYRKEKKQAGDRCRLCLLTLRSVLPQPWAPSYPVESNLLQVTETSPAQAGEVHLSGSATESTRCIGGPVATSLSAPCSPCMVRLASLPVQPNASPSSAGEAKVPAPVA